MYQKPQSYELQFLRYEVRGQFFDSLGYFLPFYPPLTTRKIQMLKKGKKTPGDIILLHMCTLNEDHMMYVSWDNIRYHRQSFLSFRAIFCPFPLLTTQKIYVLTKWKKHFEISSFYIWVYTTDANHHHTWDIKCDRQNFCTNFCPSTQTTQMKKNTCRYYHFTTLVMCNINDNYTMSNASEILEHNSQKFLSFWAFFALSPHKQPKKSKFWKNEKITGHIIIL